MTIKTLIGSIILVFTIVSGIALSRGGRPLSTLLLTIHKLIGLGTIIFLAITVIKELKSIDSGKVILAMTLITGLFAVLLFVSGVLLSFEKSAPKYVLYIHNGSTYGFVILLIITFYLMLGRR